MELETDNHKKTFGSTFIIHFIKYMQNNSRQINLYAKVIIIADMFFSLDTIEHGILRKGKDGYLKNPF
jgi:hypothetical protein